MAPFVLLTEVKYHVIKQWIFCHFVLENVAQGRNKVSSVKLQANIYYMEKNDCLVV